MFIYYTVLLHPPSLHHHHHYLSPGGRGNWNTSGCTLRSSTTNAVVCDCDHLTNFACLVVSIYQDHIYCHSSKSHPLFQDISARTTGTQPPLPPGFRLALEITSYVGVVLSVVGLIVLIITYLAFK